MIINIDKRDVPATARNGRIYKSTSATAVTPAGSGGGGGSVVAGVISFNTRNGIVSLLKADVEAVLTGLISSHTHTVTSYDHWNFYDAAADELIPVTSDKTLAILEGAGIEITNPTDIGGVIEVTIKNRAYASQSANKVFASPNGSAGVPTFRTIVPEDLPTLTAYAVAPIFERLSANRSSSSTTLVDITDLTASLAANTYYEFEAVLSVYSSNDLGTKYGLHFTSYGASIEASINGASTATIAKSIRINAFDAAAGTYLTSSISGANTSGGILIKGIIITSTNAGSITIQHQKQTSGTSTIYANSFLKVTKVGIVGAG